MKLVSLLIASTSAELLFVGYTEGSGSTNKGLTILNSGCDAVDLQGYTLKLYSNGDANPGSTDTLSTTLESGATFTVCRGSSAAFAASCDVMSSTINHNGDDMYTLNDPDNNKVAQFGKLGVDPGSAYDSEDSSGDTKDNTCIRTSTGADFIAADDKIHNWDCSGAKNLAPTLTQQQILPLMGAACSTPAPIPPTSGTCPIMCELVTQTGQRVSHTPDSALYATSLAHGTDSHSDFRIRVIHNTFDVNDQKTESSYNQHRCYKTCSSWLDEKERVCVGNLGCACECSSKPETTGFMSLYNPHKDTLATLPQNDLEQFWTDRTGDQAEAQASLLTIAGYAEGSGYNKAVALFNSGCQSIDLSKYQMRVTVNSGSSSQTIQLTGSLAGGASFMVCNNKQSTFSGCDLTTSKLIHNGNDVISIITKNTEVDAIGTQNVYFGKDRTCMKKPSSISSDMSDWDCSLGQNAAPSASEIKLPAAMCR